MNLSRRDFLNICKTSAMAVGLTALDILRLEELFANGAAPTVLWLQGAGCTGCSVSFLNYTASAKPASAADILLDNVNLAYHPNVMDAAGSSAVKIIDDASAKGGYILVVEGGVPTAFGGNACVAWTRGDKDVTFKDAVTGLAAKASTIICIGTCAAWGGLAAAAPNPAAVRGVKAVTGKNTINIAGCPPHPDWIVWGIAKAMLKQVGTLDSYGRPKALYSSTVHDRCPRRGTEETHTYGQDGRCVKELGCCGPATRAACPGTRWNNGTNWCVDANSLCIGCTEPTFPLETLRKAAGVGG